MRTILCAAAIALASPAWCESEFMEKLQSNYKLAETSKLAEKSCGVCHVSDEDFAFNPYGKDMKAYLAEKGLAEPNVDAFVALEARDSDGDGTMNGDEIKADTFPGDPASGGKPGVTAPATAPAEAKKPAFPPKNGFHPAIVHFPIALFVAGLFLDFVGLLKNMRELLLAGWYNIVLGAVTALGGVLSGVFAMSLMKLPYKGLIYQHLSLAIAATVIMWVMVAMRVHRHEKMNLPVRVVYYILAAACFFIVSWAGHLGGVFVYGE